MKNLKFPRRWTFRFLFNQRVSDFLFLANWLLWDVNCARSYGTRVAFCFWEYSYNITMCGHLIICQFCADLRNIQSVRSRFLFSHVLLLCVRNFCGSELSLSLFVIFLISLSKFLHIFPSFLVSTAASARFLTPRHLPVLPLLPKLQVVVLFVPKYVAVSSSP